MILTGPRRDLELRGVVLHRPTDRTRLLPQKRYGIPCTNILRTLIDLGAVDLGGVHTAVGHAVATGLASLDAIETATIEHAARGRSGTVALREAVADWAIEDKPADSVLELAMKRLVERFGLPLVEIHPVIEGHEIDFRVVESRVLLECDGWAHHGLDRGNFERDRTRDADLVAAGWIVLRFTYRAIITRPKSTADRILAAIDRWELTAAPAPRPPDAA